MNTVNKTEVVRARIEPKVKRSAESILKRLGVSHSTFINMSYRAVVEANGIPLSLHIPNSETATALNAAKIPAKRQKYAKAENVADLIAQMRS